MYKGVGEMRGRPLWGGCERCVPRSQDFGMGVRPLGIGTVHTLVLVFTALFTGITNEAPAFEIEKAGEENDPKPGRAKPRTGPAFSRTRTTSGGPNTSATLLNNSPQRSYSLIPAVEVPTSPRYQRSGVHPSARPIYTSIYNLEGNVYAKSYPSCEDGRTWGSKTRGAMILQPSLLSSGAIGLCPPTQMGVRRLKYPCRHTLPRDPPKEAGRPRTIYG